MEKIGKVLELFISQSGKSSRVKQIQIDVDNNGVLNDKFYAKDIERSVLITSKQSYEIAREKNININYGELGENLVIDYNPYDLPIGSKIKIGDAVLEISQHCTLCKNLSKVDSKLPKLLKKDRGVFAKVIECGSIKKDATIYSLKIDKYRAG